MTRVIEIRLPAGEDNIWTDEAASKLLGKMTFFEIDAVRVFVQVIDARVDPSDPGYLLMRLRMPRET